MISSDKISLILISIVVIIALVISIVSLLINRKSSYTNSDTVDRSKANYTFYYDLDLTDDKTKTVIGTIPDSNFTTIYQTIYSNLSTDRSGNNVIGNYQSSSEITVGSSGLSTCIRNYSQCRSAPNTCLTDATTCLQGIGSNSNSFTKTGLSTITINNKGTIGTITFLINNFSYASFTDKSYIPNFLNIKQSTKYDIVGGSDEYLGIKGFVVVDIDPIQIKKRTLYVFLS